MSRRRRPIPRLLRNVALLAMIGAGFLLFLLPRQGEGPPSVAGLAGHAVVIDGDTILLNGQRVRLEGLDAPESAQVCERSGVPWPCGADATLALRLRLEGREVRCADLGRDRFGRILGQCWVGEEDVGAWLVREGWAVAYTRYSWRYLPQEIAARWDGRGLWGGRFENPEDWRRRNPR
jgi:endonuclease YncB( thermonuclease family)